jgi:hypothetical protein
VAQQAAALRASSSAHVPQTERMFTISKNVLLSSGCCSVAHVCTFEVKSRAACHSALSIVHCILFVVLFVISGLQAACRAAVLVLISSRCQALCSRCSPQRAVCKTYVHRPRPGQITSAFGTSMNIY